MAPTRRELLEAGAAAALAAALPSPALAARRARPNIVLIVVDTLRADHVGAYGGRARTPNIDALAARGLRFTRFYPEAMATVPARRSILTGRRVWPFRGWHQWPGLMSTPGWQPIADPASTFTSALRRAGYWTGYVTDNPFLGFNAHYGGFRGSFDRFVRIGGQLGRTAAPSTVSRRELEHWLVPELREHHIEERVRRFLAAGGGYSRDETRSWAARVFTAATAELDEARARRPFALVVDTFEPHEPWTPPRNYVDLYGKRDYRGPEPSMGRYYRVAEWLSPRRAGPVLERMRDLYAAEVTMTDRWLAVLTDRLTELDLTDNTVIALVSDHGFLFGEHGWTGKIASMLHPELIHVPCLLVDPRTGGRARVSGHLAQTHDLGPTLLSLARVRPPKGMDGADLSPLLRGRRAPERTLAYGGYANWHYARSERWGFVSNNRGRGRRVYDLDRDARELHNLASRHPDLIDDLARAVRRRAGGRPPVYDGQRAG
jgi:arylsulfatase A-like enzyme